MLFFGLLLVGTRANVLLYTIIQESRNLIFPDNLYCIKH